jgi:hypothetical protein
LESVRVDAGIILHRVRTGSGGRTAAHPELCERTHVPHSRTACRSTIVAGDAGLEVRANARGTCIQEGENVAHRPTAGRTVDLITLHALPEGNMQYVAITARKPAGKGALL